MRMLLVLVMGLLGGCASQEKSSELRVQSSELEGRIQRHIKDLDDNKPQVRENATNELTIIGKLAEPQLQETLKRIKGRNAEVEWRTKLILRMIAIQDRAKLSEGLLKEFPNIYHDLATDDANNKFEILRKVEEGFNVTDNDVAGVIGELLLDEGWELSKEQKATICAISAGYDEIDINEEGYHSMIR